MIKIGDVVSFKELKMTVDHVDGDIVHCKWFVGDKLNEGWFYISTLERSK